MERMRILVTGGAGSIGSALVRSLYADGHEVTVLDNDEYGLYKIKRELPVNTILGSVTTAPLRGLADFFDLAFHCAALKHVGFCEANPDLATEVNYYGTERMALEFKGKLILLSTDKAVNPTTVLGRSKQAAEAATLVAGGTVVRLCNIMHTRGSFTETMDWQVSQGKPITVTDPDMQRYFISIETAVKLLKMAARLPAGCIVIPSAELSRLGDMVKLMYPDHPVEIIGAQPGEKMIEELYSESELQLASIYELEAGVSCLVIKPAVMA